MVSALPHRLQQVAEVSGRRFFNDSLSTTPESTAAALEAFSAPVILLAGGYDKRIDLSPMAEAIAHKAKAVALMGQTAEHLEELIADRTLSRPIPTNRCGNFEEAFAWACRESAPGDTVVLSPGCASYGWFSNYAERGDRFVELVIHWRDAQISSRPAH